MKVESVKARLKNTARNSGKNMQDILIAYGLERTIYRISISKYNINFTLKGGIFLYAIMNGDFTRMTTDIDFLAQDISHSIEKMRDVFIDIFSIKTDDLLFYDIETMKIKRITEFKEYYGVNVSIMTYLDRTRIPVSIDIGFDDVIYPQRVIIDFPVILNNEVPKIYAYSLSSSVAEKFEAIVSLGYDNSRFKDFYDIYILLGMYDFDGNILSEAIKQTFIHRKTNFDNIVIYRHDFTEDIVRRNRWKSFAKKKKISLNITLVETIEEIKKFLDPIVNAIKNEENFNKNWDHESKKWIQNSK